MATLQTLGVAAKMVMRVTIYGNVGYESRINLEVNVGLREGKLSSRDNYAQGGKMVRGDTETAPPSQKCSTLSHSHPPNGALLLTTHLRQPPKSLQGCLNYATTRWDRMGGTMPIRQRAGR